MPPVLRSVASNAIGQRTRRRTERPLAWTTIACLCVYAPAETWVSRGSLSSPRYIVDVIAFALLAFGGVWLLRHPHGVGPISAAWAWGWGYCAALGWRSSFLRVDARSHGLPIDDVVHMRIERLVGIAAVVAFAMLAWRIALGVTRTTARQP